MVCKKDRLYFNKNVIDSARKKGIIKTKIIFKIETNEMGKDCVNKSETMANPTRLRILQTLALQHTATAKEIALALPDISRATIYRHLGIMVTAGLLSIVEEVPIRGTVEKRYAIANEPQGEAAPSKDQIRNFIGGYLVHLITDFDQYFRREDVDIEADKLFVNTATLELSEEEYLAFLTELGQVLQRYASLTPAPGRRKRKITTISSPVAENSKE